jgi:hypothetical protein
MAQGSPWVQDGDEGDVEVAAARRGAERDDNEDDQAPASFSLATAPRRRRTAPVPAAAAPPRLLSSPLSPSSLLRPSLALAWVGRGEATSGGGVGRTLELPGCPLL